MRRYNPPFNGKQYLLNTNTGEIHDLDCETGLCRIDEIKNSHIYMANSYMSALVAGEMMGTTKCPRPNGCHYCMPSKDNG